LTLSVPVFAPISRQTVSTLLIYSVVLTHHKLHQTHGYTWSTSYNNYFVVCSYIILHGNIDQSLVNSLYSLLNYEIGGLDGCVITIE